MANKIISKKEFKLTIAPKPVRVGSWMFVDEKEFKSNPDKCWKELRDQIVNGKRDRFKNFFGEEFMEDGKVAPRGKVFIGMNISAHYKNYKGYLLEQKDQLLNLVYMIDCELGIRSAIKE